MKRLLCTQGIEKLATFMEERKSDSLLGPLLRGNYKWSLSHIGIRGWTIVSEDCDTFYVLLLPTWMKSLWEFSCKRKLEIPGHGIDFELQRGHYFFMMSMSYQTWCKNKKIFILNRRRRFLEIISEADTTNRPGKQVYREIYLGKRKMWRRSRLV